MKTDRVLTGVEWDSDDIPAVIPKRLWDSLVCLQESIVRVGEASCGAVQRTISAIRKGECIDDAPAGHDRRNDDGDIGGSQRTEKKELSRAPISFSSGCCPLTLERRTKNLKRSGGAGDRSSQSPAHLQPLITRCGDAAESRMV